MSISPPLKDGDKTPLSGLHPGGEVSPHIPANTSYKCLAGEGITTAPLRMEEGGAPLGTHPGDGITTAPLRMEGGAPLGTHPGEGTAVPSAPVDAPTQSSIFTMPISPGLRTFLAAQQYLDPALYKYLYELGVTDIEEISFVSPYQLPQAFPTCKFIRLQHAAQSQTGLPSGTPATVTVTT